MKILIYLLIAVTLIFALRLGELYTQLARYQKYWDAQNKLSVKKESFVYLALGDSVAQGIGASRPENGYVGLIAKEIEKSTGTPVKIINLSKSGAKIHDVSVNQLTKLDQLNLENVDLITLDVGANDMIDFNAKNFESDMDKLMVKLPKQTVISDVPSFLGGRFAKLEPKINQANNIMRSLASKHGFELVPVHETVSTNHGFRVFAADYFHPSSYGYKTNWAKPFLNQINIEQNYKPR